MRHFVARRAPPQQEVQGLSWPAHTPAYLPTLPGHASYGMDANGGGLPSNIYFVDNLSTAVTGALDPALGANVWRCTWDFAWKHNNTGRHKIIVPLVSGWIPFQSSRNSLAGVPNMSYWGQGAPGMGLFLRGGAPRVNGNNDVRLWHLASYMGNDAVGLPVANRDCLNVGAEAFAQSSTLVINGEFFWPYDEATDAFYRNDLYAALYCAYGESWAPVPKGPIFGGGGYVNRVCMFRNLFAHFSDRQPLTSSNYYAHTNNLHYNPGRIPTAGGECVNIQNNADFNTLPQYANVVRNMVVRGPDNDATLILIRVITSTGTIPANSACYIEGNAQSGWAAPASQAGFIRSVPVGYTVSGTLLPTAWPAGWGDALEGSLQFAANPLAPTVFERSSFTDLVCNSVGCKPAYRDVATSRIEVIRNQILNRINGVTGEGSQLIQETLGGSAMLSAGGWFNVPEITIADPTNPGAHWHAPIPLGTDRDDILLTGTFSNGQPKAGYSQLSAWCIEQHYFVGGS